MDGAFMSYFPILTPPPAVDTTGVDTTGHGGDTTAVDMVDGVGRYVSLTPNPAADRVQVLSSFGLKQVEAYNAEGRLVYADEAHGLSKTIDLAAWPRGIYLVRVVTPMGSTTKKLVLR
ncbi:MAG: T9SS type A sorting domain-containing protein [Bacteroidales bacterium]|nr:T9SS type A sorting domain-containing protein [Bacteroidales bacterium]